MERVSTVLFGKSGIDYSSAQFDTSKHCTEPELQNI